MTLFDPAKIEKAMLGPESQSGNTEGRRRIYTLVGRRTPVMADHVPLP